MSSIFTYTTTYGIMWILLSYILYTSNPTPTPKGNTKVSFQSQLERILYLLSTKPTHAQGPKKPNLAEQDIGKEPK